MENLPHVFMVNYDYASSQRSPDDLLGEYYSLREWAEALHEAGLPVEVWQRFHSTASVIRQGVAYHFVGDELGPHLRPWQLPRRLHGSLLARALEVGEGGELVVHVNGLVFPLQTGSLRRRLPRRFPLVVQHHAERPWPPPRSWLQAVGLRRVDAFLFAAEELAQAWRRRRLLPDRAPVYEVMEGSTRFTVASRERSRRSSGLSGDPVILWVGELIERKDPLTVLEALESFLPECPEARVYMVFRGGELEREVRLRVASSPVLRRSLKLLGEATHAGLEVLYNSADYFVLGSRSEGSGYALAEALACGVVPIVTDIPSFRMMTAGGRVGGLWRVGDSCSLRSSLRETLSRPRAAASAAARSCFDEHLAFPAIARQVIGICAELLARS